MSDGTNRRDVLKLLGMSGVGVVFPSALAGCAFEGQVNVSGPAAAAKAPQFKDFFFLQLTDMHYGFKGPPNPESEVTLKNVVKLINTSTRQPDFIVFTGDLSHTTDDPAERRRRLKAVKEITSELKVKNLKFLPGEHDASLDDGAAYKEIFGDVYYSFDHEGIHFVALDNVTDLEGGLGDKQLAWLEADLAKTHPDTPVIVFAHRPLFDCIQRWEWYTKDGEKAIAILQKRKNVHVFYGHIHQDHFHMTGNIPHRSAKSLIFPLPTPTEKGNRRPLPWNPNAADHGIGFRQMVIPSGDAGSARAAELTDFNTAGTRSKPASTESPIAPGGSPPVPGSLLKPPPPPGPGGPGGPPAGGPPGPGGPPPGPMMGPPPGAGPMMGPPPGGPSPTKL